MIRSLARVKFIDRKWAGRNLDDLAEYWSRLCQRAEGARNRDWNPEHALELRLTGFPRVAGQTIRATLTQRYAAIGLTVTMPDPDTLIISWWLAEALPPGLGLPLLTETYFDGLAIEIRLCFSEQSGPLESTTVRGFTLVLSGRLLDNKLLVKSLWGGHADASENGIYDAPTPWEKKLLAGFDRFRETGDITRRLAKALFFPDEPPDEGAVSRLMNVPFGRQRLFGLIVRCVVVALGLAIAGPYLVVSLVEKIETLFLAIPLFLVWCFVFWTFARREFRLLFRVYRQRQAENAERYQNPTRYTRLTPEQAGARLDDPIVLKHTAHVIDAGFVHVGDVSSIPIEQANVVYRIFHAPDRMTYLVLVCLIKGEDKTGPYWPISVGFECQTFFSDGGRADSINYATHESYEFEPPPSTRLLTFPQATDPLSLFRLHTAVVDALVEETAATPVRHEPFDQYIRRQEQISEDECQGYANRPYSFRDHLRWYLQLDAKPSSESK